MRRHHDVRCVRLRFSAKRNTSDILLPVVLQTPEKWRARIDALSKTVSTATEKWGRLSCGSRLHEYLPPPSIVLRDVGSVLIAFVVWLSQHAT